MVARDDEGNTWRASDSADCPAGILRWYPEHIIEPDAEVEPYRNVGGIRFRRGHTSWSHFHDDWFLDLNDDATAGILIRNALEIVPGAVITKWVQRWRISWAAGDTFANTLGELAAMAILSAEVAS